MKKLMALSALLLSYSVAHAVDLTDPGLKQIGDDFLSTYGIASGKTMITAIPISAECDGYKGDSYSGTVRADSKMPIDENSIFQIGSITKSFISVVLLQYEAEGIEGFSINDTVGKWFPEYPAWGNATIKQVMNMTSGIPDGSTKTPVYMKMVVAHPYDFNMDKRAVLEYNYNNMLNPKTGIPLDFTPGTSWSYSNTGYTLLGVLIQKIHFQHTGYPRSAEEIVIDNVVRPLGLKNTYFPIKHPFSPIPLSKLHNLVHGYFNYNPSNCPDDAKWFCELLPHPTDVTEYSMREGNTAGAMESTVDDVQAYIRALFRPAKQGGILPKQQLAELTTLVDEETGQPSSEGYGLGIVGAVVPSINLFAYRYGGAYLGYIFEYVYIPEKNTSFSFAINSRSDVIDNGDLIGEENSIATKIYNYVSSKCSVN